MRRLSNVKFNPKNDKGINDSNENPIKTQRRVEHTSILSNATDTNIKFETKEKNRIKICPDNANINKKEVEEHDLDVNSLTDKTYVAPALGDKLVATETARGTGLERELGRQRGCGGSQKSTSQGIEKSLG